MNPKALLSRVDGVMDPIGIAFLVVTYFANKYLNLGLTVDEVLLASIGMGAVRTAYERWKRRGKAAKAAKPAAPTAAESPPSEVDTIDATTEDQ